VRREGWLRVKQLFDAGRDMTPDERQAFLADACKDDAPLHDEVQSLIDSYLQSGTFLEDSTNPSSWLANGLEGRRIGPYDIGPRIGAGGMGEVYSARDTRLNRSVAIKVRNDRLMWRPDVREQWTREAKAISSLNHPNICLLHDVGQEDELDFLVMEYVEGEAIDAYCNQRGLDVPQRLALFCTICDAVHYAHQNLVVHRDLKPANILVTRDGQPKLLDFGIAKLIEPDSTGGTITAYSPILTPDYASPEQVKGETVTTATDVYSLGVVLYELLAGRRPFTVTTASLEDLVDTICEVEPAPPSVARRDSCASTTVSTRAPRQLHGDLDTIVLKALRKEPGRRYLSAQALSDDIKRHLAGQPVAARGDAVSYRVSKFIRRHRVAAIVAGVFIVTLLAAMALIVRQAQIAEAQRQRAERRFADVRRLAGSFLFEFHDAIKQLPGSTRARELVAKRALEYLDSLAAESANDPTLRAELARAYQRVGDVQGAFREANLGNVAGALTSYRKALELQEGLVSAGSADRSVQRDLAATLIGLGDVQIMKRDLPAAVQSFRRALTIRETLASGTTPDRDTQRQLAIAYHHLADTTGQLGNRTEAVSGLQRAIGILEPLAANTSDIESRHALARSYKALGMLRAALRDYDENLAMVQKALRLNEALMAADPLNITVRSEVAVSWLEVGRAHERLKNLTSALESFRNAERIRASLVAADPSNAQSRWMRGLELNLIGNILVTLHQPQEALVSHLESLALLEGVLRADPNNENYHYNVANTHQLIGEAFVVLARAASTGAERVRAWTSARASYQRSADIFDGMRKRGTLTGSLVPDSEAVAAALVVCARELSKTAPGADPRSNRSTPDRATPLQ